MKKFADIAVEYGPECVLHWPNGWMIVVEFVNDLPRDPRIHCSLITPNGDGYWSKEIPPCPQNVALSIAELHASAVIERFTPPDLRVLREIIPDSYLEGRIRAVSEVEWVQ